MWHIFFWLHVLGKIKIWTKLKKHKFQVIIFGKIGAYFTKSLRNFLICWSDILSVLVLKINSQPIFKVIYSSIEIMYDKMHSISLLVNPL